MARKRILAQLQAIRRRLFGMLWGSPPMKPHWTPGRAMLPRSDDEREWTLFVIRANAGMRKPDSLRCSSQRLLKGYLMKPSIPRLAASAAALLLALSLLPILAVRLLPAIDLHRWNYCGAYGGASSGNPLTTLDDDLDCHRRPLQSHRSLAPAPIAPAVAEPRLRGAVSHLCAPVSFVAIRTMPTCFHN